MKNNHTFLSLLRLLPLRSIITTTFQLCTSTTGHSPFIRLEIIYITLSIISPLLPEHTAPFCENSEIYGNMPSVRSWHKPCLLSITIANMQWSATHSCDAIMCKSVCMCVCVCLNVLYTVDTVGSSPAGCLAVFCCPR